MVSARVLREDGEPHARGVFVHAPEYLRRAHGRGRGLRAGGKLPAQGHLPHYSFPQYTALLSLRPHLRLPLRSPFRSGTPTQCSGALTYRYV